MIATMTFGTEEPRRCVLLDTLHMMINIIQIGKRGQGKGDRSAPLFLKKPTTITQRKRMELLLSQVGGGSLADV